MVCARRLCKNSLCCSQRRLEGPSQEVLLRNVVEAVLPDFPQAKRPSEGASKALRRCFEDKQCTLVAENGPLLVCPLLEMDIPKKYWQERGGPASARNTRSGEVCALVCSRGFTEQLLPRCANHFVRCLGEQARSHSRGPWQSTWMFRSLATWCFLDVPGSSHKGSLLLVDKSWYNRGQYYYIT